MRNIKRQTAGRRENFAAITPDIPTYNLPSVRPVSCIILYLLLLRQQHGCPMATEIADGADPCRRSLLAGCSHITSHLTARSSLGQSLSRCLQITGKLAAIRSPDGVFPGTGADRPASRVVRRRSGSGLALLPALAVSTGVLMTGVRVL